jgi:ABC-type Mn2+/Zn2+ transport system permease subunit
MIDFLLEPLSYSFVVRGFAAGLLAALACSVLSAFVVWRGMAFVGDALAHAILPGIVVAYIFRFQPLFRRPGRCLAGGIRHRPDIRSGQIKRGHGHRHRVSGFFAFGVLLLSSVTSYQDLGHILFGNILGVSGTDLYWMSGVVVFTLGALALSYKEILVASFDPAHSVAIGLSPALIRYILLLLLAMTTVVAIQTVGVILVLSLLVTPAAAASLISKRLKTIVILSVAMALTATVIGFYLSYYADLASGPAIVLTLTLFFALAFIWSRFREMHRQ